MPVNGPSSDCIWRWPLTVGLAALVVRLVVVGLHVAAPDALAAHDANSELVWIARNLAAGRGFASPFDVGTTPSAWLSPFVPGLWALLIAALGDGRAFLAGALGFNALAGAAAVALYAALFPHLLAPRRPSRRAQVLVAALFCLWPPSLRLITVTWYYAWQELCIALLFLGLLRWPVTHYAPRWTAWLALAGIAAAYINPSPLVLLPPACLWLLWQAGNPKSESRKPKQARSANGECGNRTDAAAPICPVRISNLFRISRFGFRISPRPLIAMSAVALAILVAMLPWLVRCHTVLGRWMPMRSSFGVELRQGNNPQGSVRQTAASLHPALRPDERARYDAVGEGAYTADALAAAIAYMRDDPGPTWRRVACRLYVYWCSDLLDRWPWQARPAWWRGPPALWLPWLVKTALFLAPLGLALITAAAGWWRGLNGRWLLASFLLVFPIPYYFTHVQPEYAYPVQPYLLLFACAAILAVRGKTAPALGLR